MISILAKRTKNRALIIIFLINKYQKQLQLNNNKKKTRKQTENTNKIKMNFINVYPKPDQTE